MTIITWEVISSVWNLASEVIVNFPLHAVRPRDCIVSCAHISLIAEGGSARTARLALGSTERVLIGPESDTAAREEVPPRIPRVLQRQGSAGGLSTKWKRINRKARGDGSLGGPDSFIPLLT